MPAGGGVVGKPVSHRGRCSYAEYIGDARTHCRSTCPGCECQPAAAELSANPFRTEGGAPTRNISEKPEPPRRSTRPGCECQPAAEWSQTRFAPRAVLLHRAYRRSPNPL